MSEAVQVAVEAALAAGKILRERKDSIGKISYKEFYDPVTEVDLLCEQTIISRIKKTFPQHDILAEESGSTQGNSSTSTWIIDPLDGTLNYSHGYPCYCVSIGLEHEGRLEVGVVYNPCLDELFVAERGKGATLNSKPIKVSTISTLRESLLVTGFHPRVINSMDDNLNHFCRLMKLCQAVRRPGSAAMDMVYTAMGRFEGFWELKLSPWDVAAGALIVTEAGGAPCRSLMEARQRFTMRKSWSATASSIRRWWASYTWQHPVVTSNKVYWLEKIYLDPKSFCHIFSGQGPACLYEKNISTDSNHCRWMPDRSG